MKLSFLNPAAKPCRYKEVYGIAINNIWKMEADDKWFTKALRTTLIVLFTLQLVSTLERQVFDFLGYMWAPIIGNFFQIIVVILGIFGACNFYRSFIVVYATWNLLWLGWNIFVICLYLEVGILNRDRERYILTIGTESKSWWLEHGIGCEVNQSSWLEDDGLDSTEEGGRRIPPEDSVVGCILQYYYVEVIHAGVQCLLSLGGFVASCICIYSFIEGDDPSKYPVCRGASPMDLCSGRRMPDSPLLPFSDNLMPGFSSNISPRQAQKETGNGARKWKCPSYSLFSRCKGFCSRQMNRERSQRKRKKTRNHLDSSMFHSPYLSRLRSPLPSLPHIAFPLTSLPATRQSKLPSSDISQSSSSVRTLHPSLWSGQSRQTNLRVNRSSHLDSPSTGNHSFTTLTPPSYRYLGPSQQIQNLMNAFSSSSSSPSSALPRPQTIPTWTGPQQQQYGRSSSNHNACSSFFSYQVNTQPSYGENQQAAFTTRDGVSRRDLDQERIGFRERQTFSHGYQFEDQPRWSQDRPNGIWGDEEHKSYRKGPTFRYFYQDHKGGSTESSFINSSSYCRSKRLEVSHVDSWLSEDDGEDEVFLSNQEMQRLREAAERNFILGGDSDSDDDDVWVLQTEL